MNRRRLSRRERATAAASLLELKHHGIDPGEVERTAETMSRMGTPEPQAWGKAFEKAMDAKPSIRAPLMRIERVLESTDTQTLSRYSNALEKAYRTGDESELAPIASMLAQHLTKLAQETGDAGFVDGLPNDVAEPAHEQPPNHPPRPGWDHTGYHPGQATEARGTEEGSKPATTE